MSLLSKLHQRVDAYNEKVINKYIPSFDETITDEQWQSWESRIIHEMLHDAEDGFENFRFSKDCHMPIPVFSWKWEAMERIRTCGRGHFVKQNVLGAHVNQVADRVFYKVVAWWNKRHPDVTIEVEVDENGYVRDLNAFWKRSKKRHRGE